LGKYGKQAQEPIDNLCRRQNEQAYFDDCLKSIRFSERIAVTIEDDKLSDGLTKFAKLFEKHRKSAKHDEPLTNSLL